MHRILLPVFIISTCFLQISISQRLRSCVLRAVEGDKRKYKVYLTASRSSSEFKCADGTQFYQEKCLCGWPPNTDPIVTRPTRPGRPIDTRPINPSRPTDADGRPNSMRPINPNVRPTGPTTKAPCMTNPDADRNYFTQNIHGFGTVKRRCPLGTFYNHPACGCIDTAPVTSINCKPEIYIDFDNKPIGHNGGTSIPIGNNGHVDSVAKAGRFNGIGRLTIWIYSNNDFGRKLTISFRFYDFPGGPEEQVLVSNCMGNELGSVEIAVVPRHKEVVFRADALDSGPAEIRIPYKDKAWKNVTFVYDGIALRAKVDEKEDAIEMKGNLDQRAGDFQIGSCNRRGYVGYIDDLKIHRCVDRDYVIGNKIGPLRPYDARNTNLDIAGP